MVQVWSCSLLLCDLFYEAICFMPYLVLFCSCFSVLLALRLLCLGKRANLSAFRTSVRFVLVWFCRFPLPLGVWEGLRFVTVALPGLFSYLFFIYLVGRYTYVCSNSHGFNNNILWYYTFCRCNKCNRLLLSNAPIARWLTCSKILVR